MFYISSYGFSLIYEPVCRLLSYGQSVDFEEIRISSSNQSIWVSEQ